LAELSASLQQSQDGLSAKTQEVESLRLELSEKEDTIKDLKEKLAVAKNQCDAISAEKEKLQNERDNLQSNMGALKALNKRLEELEEEKKASLAAMAVLQSEKENDEANFCIICMERPSDVAVVPCGHFCLCEECAAKCNNCPICRTEKESLLKIYVGNLTV
jgi:predicted  nucleic acid-binding Zn-ribbon protein